MDGDDDEMDKAHQKRRCCFHFGKTLLFFAMMLYALLGAVIFKFLEGGERQQATTYVQKSREDCLRELWLITGELLHTELSKLLTKSSIKK